MCVHVRKYVCRRTSMCIRTNVSAYFVDVGAEDAYVHTYECVCTYFVDVGAYVCVHPACTRVYTGTCRSGRTRLCTRTRHVHTYVCTRVSTNTRWTYMYGCICVPFVSPCVRVWASCGTSARREGVSVPGRQTVHLLRRSLPRGVLRRRVTGAPAAGAVVGVHTAPSATAPPGPL